MMYEGLPETLPSYWEPSLAIVGNCFVVFERLLQNGDGLSICHRLSDIMWTWDIAKPDCTRHCPNPWATKDSLAKASGAYALTSRRNDKGGSWWVLILALAKCDNPGATIRSDDSQDVSHCSSHLLSDQHYISRR